MNDILRPESMEEHPAIGQPKAWLLIRLVSAWLICMTIPVVATSAERWELNGEDVSGQSSQLVNVAISADRPSDLIFLKPRTNNSSLQFNGRTSIAFGPPSNRDGLESNFTWEGFLLLPSTTTLTNDKGVGSRLISQFADEIGDWTRLAIGLTEDQKKRAQLSVFYGGKEGSSFGRGSIEVTRDVWHHFALVHEGATAAATITWYLDFEKCGTLYLGGQENPNILRKPGPAPFTIGARLLKGGVVNRGFNGLIDEVRLTPRACKPSEFLQFKISSIERNVRFEFFDVDEKTFQWDFSKLKPYDVLQYQALAMPGLPLAYSPVGHKTPWYGATAIRGATDLELPPGQYRFLLRTTQPAQLMVGERLLIDTQKQKPQKTSQKTRDYVVEFELSSGTKKIAMRALLKPRNYSTDTVKFLAAYAPVGEKQWRLVTGQKGLSLTSAVWNTYSAQTKRYLKTLNSERQAAARMRGDNFWRRRHQIAKQIASTWKVETPSTDSIHPVDAILLSSALPKSLTNISDAAFFRRLSLDIRGRIPTMSELEKFLANSHPDKRVQAINAMLASDEWADGWMGYWQDLLAENPSVVFPTLNNTGAFRYFLYDSFQKNVPVDRFATELMLMEGSDSSNGTSGFAIATGNDSPLAMKAHVVLNAFLDADLKCARCHDSPIDDYTQSNLFTTAAYLNDGPLTISAKNVAAVGKKSESNHSIVTTTLKAGQRVAPKWFMNETNGIKDPKREMVLQPGRPRAELAARITSPKLPRFSDVIVNRLWQRYFGIPLVADVSNLKSDTKASNVVLMRYLSQRLVNEGYDLKKLAKLILTSQAYAAAVQKDNANQGTDMAFRLPRSVSRRMTAEQLVDSLFVVSGKKFGGEVLGVGATDRGSIDLPRPERAWQFTALPNERDRPALGMPVNQTIVDVLASFGWNGSRQAPKDVRNTITTPLQPMILFNGLMSQRIVRLSDNSQITELCLEDQTVEQLVDRLFLVTLSRFPTDSQRAVFTQHLAPSFSKRLTGEEKETLPPLSDFQPDWKKHLEGEQTLLMMKAQKSVDRGEPPTRRLSSEFRKRVEDVVWSLINSPEFIFIP